MKNYEKQKDCNKTQKVSASDRQRLKSGVRHRIDVLKFWEFECHRLVSDQYVVVVPQVNYRPIDTFTSSVVSDCQVEKLDDFSFFLSGDASLLELINLPYCVVCNEVGF